MSGGTYECANCHGVFDRADGEEWNDSKAWDEYLDTYVNHDGLVVIICDDCYQAINARIRAEAPELLRPGARESS